ncbi:RCC1 domain-containing protein [Agromyces sp. ZXT2-3]|uniref:RCC1 domain-containing protein n=1 Tax=Agromyces sp. ZXT2-3 TaxID=3461152 RepID=UPI004054CC55
MSSAHRSEVISDGMVSIHLDPRVTAGAAIWSFPNRVIQVAAGGQHNLILTAGGKVLASGSNERGQTDVPSGLGEVVAIAAGYSHSLALLRDGTVVAWGNNSRGATNVPSDLHDVVAISGGGGHSAAVRRDGSVVVWGQMGFGTVHPPADLADVVSVASGWECCFAIRSDGTVAAWGETQFGVPKVPMKARFVGIDGGGGPLPSWVATETDGSVKVNGAFGEAPRHQLYDVTQVAAGEMHALALRRDGVVIGWGNSPVRHTVPAGLRAVESVAAGNDHSLALCADGTVVAWGKNGYQQLRAPLDYTSEFVAWEDDGYYLPSLGRRGPDPYAAVYGRRFDTGGSPPATRTAESTVDPRRAVIAAIDRFVAADPHDFAEMGRSQIDGVKAVHAYFYTAPHPDKQLWRVLFTKVWTDGPSAGQTQNMVGSKLVEAAGRLGWLDELAYARSLISPLPTTSQRAPAPSSGGCYVATAVYGSYDCEEVRVLRRFRDQTLLGSGPGRLAVRLYYVLSPLAIRVGGRPLRNAVRPTLDRVVVALRERGVSGAPYSDE